MTTLLRVCVRLSGMLFVWNLTKVDLATTTFFCRRTTGRCDIFLEARSYHSVVLVVSPNLSRPCKGFRNLSLGCESWFNISSTINVCFVLSLVKLGVMMLA